MESSIPRDRQRSLSSNGPSVQESGVRALMVGEAPQGSDTPPSSRSQVRGTSDFLWATGMSLIFPSQLDSRECGTPANSKWKTLTCLLCLGFEGVESMTSERPRKVG